MLNPGLVTRSFCGPFKPIDLALLMNIKQWSHLESGSNAYFGVKGGLA